MSRRRTKSERRPLVRPLVSFERLEARDVPATAFALSGTNLLAFDTANSALVQTTAITGVTAGETLAGIDFRPQNGLLYGLGVNATADTATLYAISTRTGVAGVVGTAGGVTGAGDLPDPATVGYGVDFNPAADLLRVVAGGLNFRVTPNNGTLASGDTAINGGTTTVDATAYTNNAPNTTVTTQYTLDAASNSLFIQNPPNSGTQIPVAAVTLGGSPLDFSNVNGFDIPAGVNAAASGSPVATGSGFAVLNVGGTTGLYNVDLVTGAATLVGNVGTGATAVQGLAVQSDLGGTPAIALDAAGTSLLRFNTATPGTVTTQALNLAGVVAGETLVGIDFRPATGQLYGLGIDPTAETGTLYLIAPQSGDVIAAVSGTKSAITFAGVDFPDPATAGYGLDFNPTVDRIRVTTSSGLNFRINPNTGLPAAATVDGAITGLPTGSTGVSATAYTNSFGQSLTGGVTTQYTLDAASNSLFIQNPPNNGTQTNPLPVTLSGAPLDFTDVTGFDIPAGVRVGTSNAVASGFGYASLTVGGTTSLYRIDLATGAAANLGAVGAGATALAGFALADAPAGSVAFASAAVSQSEAGPTATINLARTGGTTGAVTVTVNVTGGTATAGADFTAGPYTATFADGAATASFTIALVDDAIFEGNETIALTIASATNAAVIGLPSAATVTITENDPQQSFTVNAATGYALVGATLVPFATTNPAAAGAPITIVGVDAGETLVAIDFRPQNGQLYGLGVNATANTATLYAISTVTGQAGAVGTIGAIAFVDAGGAAIDLPDPAAVNYDIDINPAVDRLRVVAGAINFRVDPNTGNAIDGAAGTAGTNTDGAINGGTTTVGGTAYTNAFPNNGGVTTQYTLDAATDSLYIQSPPNNGTQTGGKAITLGGSPLDFTAVKGFDILANVTAPSANAAVTAGSGLAILTVGGVDGLYSIDLTTGAAALLGSGGAATAQSVAFQSDLGATPTIALNAAGTALVRSLSNNVANPFTVGVTGVTAGETLVGIDFRPQTGQLFALGVNSTADTGTIYRLDPQTGAATAIGTAGAIAFVDAAGAKVELPDPATTGYGFDFNPTVDRIRITTSTGLNARANPNTGAPVDGDTVAAGVQPDAAINGPATGASAVAYTNAFGQPLAGGVTSQYTLDATTNSLFIQNPPNSGTQTSGVPITLGGAPLDFTDVNGFNIPSNVRVTTAGTAVASGTGFAALTVGGVSGLYAINLVTGAATLLGTAPAALSALATANTPTGIVEFTTATFSVAEAGPTVALTLTRTGGTSGALTVTVSFAAGTADGTDYTTTPVVVTFADGQTTATALVPITADTTFEADETFTAMIGAATNGGVIGAVSTATVTITNDDPAPTATIDDLTAAEGNAGTTAYTFTVTLSNPSDQTITLNVNTADGTATAGSDYTAVSGLVLTFAPGETTKTVTVNVTGDTVNEADESFNVVLSVTGPSGEVPVDTGVGTITNDDAAPVLTISSAAAMEGNAGTTTYTFTVTLTGTTAQTVTVAVASANNTATAGSDFTALAPQTLTFLPGETTKTVTVTVAGDTTVENDETFFVVLSAPTNATLGATFKGVGTIVNDDSAPASPGVLLVGEDVTAVGAGNGAPTVRLVAADGTQISSGPAFPAAFTGGVRTAVADVNGDGTPDVIVGTGPGTVSLLRVLDGATGKELFSVQPFEDTFTGGVFVAAGDVNGDGTPDIVVSPDVTGGPRVDIFSGKDFTKIDSFFSIDDANFRGGVRVAVGDVNGDGTGDVVVAAGIGGGPRVAVFNGKTLGSAARTRLFNDIFVFESTLTNGAFIAAGDVNGDGKADLIAGGGPGGGPRVTVFDAASLISSGGGTLTQLANFFAGGAANRLGVQVAVKDVDSDTKADLRTVVGGSNQVVTYLGKDLTPTGTPPSTTADGLPGFNGGVFVG